MSWNLLALFVPMVALLFLLRWQRSAPKARRFHGPYLTRPLLELLEGRLVPSTFTVTNTSSDPSQVGSLPYVIALANATSGLNYINFDIPGSGPQVIDAEFRPQPYIQVPLANTVFNITNQVVINGASQPGYNGSPLIIIVGGFNLTSVGASTSSGSTIEGLDIQPYPTTAAITVATNGNYILNNWIGFVPIPPQSPALASDATGIQINANGNTIISNTISGTTVGIQIGGTSSGYYNSSSSDYAPPAPTITANSIRGNNIGTDPTGTTTAGYGNTQVGVYLGVGAVQNLVGPNNVLAGNAGSAIELADTTTTGNIVFSNFIGTDRSTTLALGNGQGVVVTNDAYGNCIGGPFGGNYIDDNGSAGIVLGENYGGASYNFVQFNVIGLNASQTAAVGSQTFGIYIQEGATENLVQSNVVANSQSNGIVIDNAYSNYVYTNWIGRSYNGTPFANQGFGIALIDYAGDNFIQGNVSGPNALGPYYVDVTAMGNVIQ